MNCVETVIEDKFNIYLRKFLSPKKKNINIVAQWLSDKKALSFKSILSVDTCGVIGKTVILASLVFGLGAENPVMAASKTVYVGSSTSPATTVPTGSTVTYVIDVGTNANTQPAAGSTLSLNDTLLSTFTNVTAPAIPPGWTNSTAPVPGTTTIAQYLQSNNVPPTASTSSNVTMVPLPEGNVYAAATIVPPPSIYTDSSGGDGYGPLVVKTGSGILESIAVNHHLVNPPVTCMNLSTGLACTGTSPNLSLPGVTSGVIFRQVQIGNFVYAPAQMANGNFGYACVNVTATVEFHLKLTHIWT